MPIAGGGSMMDDFEIYRSGANISLRCRRCSNFKTVLGPRSLLSLLLSMAERHTADRHPETIGVSS